jgi:hypothetical protein|tara:strand:- start:325 stop:489 length:165 start_codon:yes stop_codon:yes gene_type:complete
MIVTKDNGGFTCWGKFMGRMCLSFSPNRKEAIQFFAQLVDQMKKEQANEHQRIG